MIEVWADYVCPWCYLALDLVDHLEQTHGLQVRWHPYELHPEVPFEGAALPKHRISPDARSELRTELEQAGLPVRRRETVSNSARALALSTWAADRPEWPILHRGLFAAYWADGRDLGDPTELEHIAQAAGLDPAEASAAIADGAGRTEVEDARERALDLGIGGTPGWHFGDGVVLVGAHPAHILDRVIARR